MILLNDTYLKSDILQTEYIAHITSWSKCRL